MTEAGWDAWVFHPTDGFVFSELIDADRVLMPSTYQCRPSDVLVLPEDAGQAMATMAPGLRKLIFNHAAYRTSRHFQEPFDALPPYRHAEVIGVLVVSDDSRRYLNYASPGCPASVFGSR